MPAAKKARARRKGRLDKEAMQSREAAIITDLKAGKLSYRDIAKKHDVSLPTVNAKARKAGIRRPRGRRPAAAKGQAYPAPAQAGRLRSQAMGQILGRRGPGRPRKADRAAFQDEFREMLLRHFPSLTLAQYDRLTRMVTEAVS